MEHRKTIAPYLQSIRYYNVDISNKTVTKSFKFTQDLFINMA